MAFVQHQINARAAKDGHLTRMVYYVRLDVINHVWMVIAANQMYANVMLDTTLIQLIHLSEFQSEYALSTQIYYKTQKTN